MTFVMLSLCVRHID